ncbi:hypothetical protein EDD22DRAFT_848227 [Suillus occidentalis]|nr:hypothetical protein EDD22DRAFT_848227 [Suillus occidentalis]
MFIGFGKSIKVKMVWPMATANLSLESIKDNYFASTITLEAQNNYCSHQENLYVAILRMCGATHLIETKKLASEVQFLHHNILAGFPPNIFVIVINMHSNEFSGILQHTGGHTGGTNTTIMEILLLWMGSGTLPFVISNTVRSFMMEIGVFGQKDVWAGLTQMLTTSNDFLGYTTAVVVCKPLSVVKSLRIVLEFAPLGLSSRLAQSKDVIHLRWTCASSIRKQKCISVA